METDVEYIDEIVREIQNNPLDRGLRILFVDNKDLSGFFANKSKIEKEIDLISRTRGVSLYSAKKQLYTRLILNMVRDMTKIK